MKLENKSQGVVWILHRALHPGKAEEFEEEVLSNPVVAALVRLGTLAEVNAPEQKKPAEDSAENVAAIIAKLKNSPEAHVRKLCEKYGVPVPEGVKLPELKQLLIAELTKEGGDDGDQSEGTGEQQPE